MSIPISDKKTSVSMTKTNRLRILQRARKILSDKTRWTTGSLRSHKYGVEQYCVLGACEKAAYELGLAEPGARAFAGFGYDLGEDLSIVKFSEAEYGLDPVEVNDKQGYDKVMELLGNYIARVKHTPAGKDPNG